jgi:hypothetical protein
VSFVLALCILLIAGPVGIIDSADLWKSKEMNCKLQHTMLTVMVIADIKSSSSRSCAISQFDWHKIFFLPDVITASI